MRGKFLKFSYITRNGPPAFYKLKESPELSDSHETVSLWKHHCFGGAVHSRMLILKHMLLI